MATRTLPAQAYLRQCFDYDPQTGVLTWRDRPREHFNTDQSHKCWTTKWPGKPAGSPNCKGYMQVGLVGTLLLNHRIIWQLVHGMVPATLDHVNGNRLDNRLANIRPCTASQNMMNRKLGGSKSGFRGVRKLKRGGWEVRITVSRQQYTVGSYPTIEDAITARIEAEARMFGDFAYQSG